MGVPEYILLVVAGFGAGIVGYVSGLASVVSYPALLAVGLSPLAANVTNTVSLVAAGVGSVAKSGRVLLDADRGRLGLSIAAALLGGVIGAATLLLAPPESFEAVVPFLVALAALALLVQPWLRRLSSRSRERPWMWYAGLVLVSVYGGYFGAGAGIMFLALAMVLTAQPLWRAALLKALLLGVANLVAAIGFIVFGPVQWSAVLALGAGCLLGGWCGPPLVQRLPATPLRITIGFSGLALAVWLALPI